MSSKVTKRIPYGLADYGRMRSDNSYYVDKTHFIPLIEASPYFIFFIRPRRFGKSLWLEVRVMLNHYYEAGELPLSVDKSIELMQEWYNNYRFGKNATQSMFNSDMVLFLVMVRKRNGWWVCRPLPRTFLGSLP